MVLLKGDHIAKELKHWLIFTLIFSQAMFGLTFSSITQTASYGYFNEGLWKDLTVAEPYIYTSRQKSFFVLNACNLQPLEVVGEIEDTYRDSHTFLKQGDYHFLVSNDPGIYIRLYDVSLPTHPTLLSSLKYPDGYSTGSLDTLSKGFVTVGDQSFLFLSNAEGHDILCINYTLPTAPVVTNLTAFPGDAQVFYNKYDLFCFHDNHLIIPTKNDTEYGLVVYNFTAYNDLVKVSDWFGETNISGVLTHPCCSGDYFCLNREHMYLEVFNIQNLTAPTREGYLEFPYNERPYFRDHYMIRFPGGWFKPNVTIYDLSDFSNPIAISNYRFPGGDFGEFNYNYFSDWMISPEHIYIPVQFTSHLDKELYVLDWSDPTNLTLAAILFFPDLSSGLFSFPLSGFTLAFLGTLTIFVLVVHRKRKKKLLIYT